MRGASMTLWGPDKEFPPSEGEVDATSADGVDLSSGIVPSSFSLTTQNSVMIISGANAGGKTVVL
ncbi:MAG TPA: hypothetical protein VNA22_02015, partial [Pyrinomonadaceae bacterium]|nr:hypothetical protein [Pyrinomonadaceae bacterium]